MPTPGQEDRLLISQLPPRLHPQVSSPLTPPSPLPPLDVSQSARFPQPQPLLLPLSRTSCLPKHKERVFHSLISQPQVQPPSLTQVSPATSLSEITWQIS